MPIRASERHRYPPRKEWLAIRARILQRAGHRCERCGLGNGWHVCRLVEYPEVAVGSGAVVHGATLGPPVKIVLTVAHLNHQPEDCRPENLQALCQRCHLTHDAAHHAANAAVTRARKALRGPGLFGEG